MTSERSYFLGTHDEELERLGIQHDVWRPTVLECWRRAGIGPGSKVLDIGAGPGFAAADLAEIVGPTGRVVAVERSARFVEAGRRMLAGRGHENFEYHELDLMTDALPAGGMDATWCRWVACFVASPAVLLDKIAAGTISGKIAKEVFEAVWSGEGTVDEIIEKRGLTQISDSASIDKLVADVIAANPAQVEQFRAGKQQVLGFLVGQIMKASRGKANPQQVNEALRKQLGPV